MKSRGSKATLALTNLLEPYILRRMKDKVFIEDNPLPEKTELVVWLELSKLQQQLYKTFLSTSETANITSKFALAAGTILRKICGDPYCLERGVADKDIKKGSAREVNAKLAELSKQFRRKNDENDNLSCKISFVASLLKALIPEKHYVLVFSQSLIMLDLIQESVESLGYSCLRIDGKTEDEERFKFINDFQEGKASMFLISSQVGGVGLTLTRADRVILVDPAWNPSIDDQSVARSYRIGQKKNVVVYRLITSNTIEEKIYAKQNFKSSLAKLVIEKEQLVRLVSAKDYKQLFELPNEGFGVSLTHKRLQHMQNDQGLYTSEHMRTLECMPCVTGVSVHSDLTNSLLSSPVEENFDYPLDPKTTMTYRNQDAVNLSRSTK